MCSRCKIKTCYEHVYVYVVVRVVCAMVQLKVFHTDSIKLVQSKRQHHVFLGSALSHGNVKFDAGHGSS